MMTLRRKIALALIPILGAGSAAVAQPAPSGQAAHPVRSLFVQDSMNVYRRFEPAKKTEMVDFYARVLQLKPLQPIDLSPTMQMILFGIGSGQIKLAAEIKPDRQYHLGGVNAGTGIRLITLYYPDEAELVARFRAEGLAEPGFVDRGDGTRAAIVEDPAGFPLQLVVAPGAPAATYEQVEVGINVSDLEKSRGFYREFVGLDELPPVPDASIGVTKYPFRHGATTINLWSEGKNLPADTGSAGIQYVINDADAVDARAKERDVTIETPLSTLPGFNLRTVWLNDPDGVTNYFAQVGAPGGEAR